MVSVKVRPSRAPILDTVTPASAPAGATVTLVGSRFGTSGYVRFEGGWVATTSSWTSTQIVATVPVGAVTGEVVVSNSHGDSDPLPFTVTTPDPPPPPPPPPEDVIATSEELTAALLAAQGGETLTLLAEATFTGPFTLPVFASSSWVLLQSSRMAELPAAGERVHPSHAPLMPRIVSPGSNQPVFLTAPGAHHFALVGLEIAPADAAALVDTLVLFGDGSSAQNQLSQVPHDLLLARCYIHGDPAGQLKRGVGLQSAATDILGCHIAECKVVGQDSQAIGGWNGPGPYLIVNNHLEAAGENVMFGGADTAIPDLTPSDITLRRNLFTKPLAWNPADPSYGGTSYTVKNLLELKHARRVTIEENIFENNWLMAQAGFAVQITPRNQDGATPWAVVEDVAFTNNIVRHSSSGINMSGHDTDYPSRAAARIRIANNLFEDIDHERWGGDGRLFQVLNGVADVVIEHNTGLQTKQFLVAEAGPFPGFVFRNNIVNFGYGIAATDTAGGTAALNALFPGWVMVGNVIPGLAYPYNAANYPPGNSYPATWEAIGMGADFRLTAQSPYRGTATDGTDPGCDVGQLAAAGGTGT